MKWATDFPWLVKLSEMRPNALCVSGTSLTVKTNGLQSRDETGTRIRIRRIRHLLGSGSGFF